MWQFIVIVYFGMNFAFSLFVLTYDFDECVVGRNVNPLVMFILNIFAGMLIFAFSMVDNVTCNLDIKRGSNEDENAIVRIFNDFKNISF